MKVKKKGNEYLDPFLSEETVQAFACGSPLFRIPQFLGRGLGTFSPV